VGLPKRSDEAKADDVDETMFACLRKSLDLPAALLCKSRQSEHKMRGRLLCLRVLLDH
jgi:hypothetical protein